MGGWLVTQAARVASPQAILWIVGVALAIIITMSGVLYWTVQSKGKIQVMLEVAKQAAEHNAEQVKVMKAEMALRDNLDAAFADVLKRIEGRFDGVKTDIRKAVMESASEDYLRCRPVAAPAGLLERLHHGAGGQDGQD